MRDAAIGIHAASGLVALVLGGSLIVRARQARRVVGYRAYLGAMILMTVALVVAVILDWSILGAASQVLFAALCGLAVVMVGQAVFARRVARTGTWPDRRIFVDRVGFTVVALVTAFTIITALDAGAPRWAIGLVGLLTVLLTRRFVRAFRPSPIEPRLRVFLAGATGVLGERVLRLLIAQGHTVAGMTRTAEKVALLRQAGAEPVVCDVFDAAGLNQALTAFHPDVVVDELTDLPDRFEEVSSYAERNDRMRVAGTRNLLAAAKRAGARHVVVQSIAWRPAGREDAVEELERQVLDVGGVVARYGQLYGPGTFYEQAKPPPPRIHVDDAAQATAPLLCAPSGVVILTEG